MAFWHGTLLVLQWPVEWSVQCDIAECPDSGIVMTVCVVVL